ncbi:MAG: nicotinate (nicotinamide) nucleotide adenylyltransferase [Solirubrobacteraceae bacterium]|nr:nicotinate (nicotinamide) nucleotide adenylyltransferase [Solirubrobacteraceae bacterium]
MATGSSGDGRRVGILGGTFNPPHVGHLMLAECARDELGLDVVLLVVAARPPHKVVDADPGADVRLELCRAAVAGEEGRLEACDVELRRDGPSYTADTLRRLTAERPEDRFTLLLGGDAAAGLESWHRPRDVCSYADVGVAERGADDHERARATLRRLGAEARLRPFTLPPVGISSTLVRARVRAGRTVRHLVPRAVEDRILEGGLYRS